MNMGFNHGIHRIHGMIISLVLLFGFAVSAVAAEPGITVEARQRYPWNGLVDLKFTITGESGTKYDTSFTAKDMVGGTNVAMKTIRKSDGVAAEEKEKLLPGLYNWVWDAAADLPKDFKCERMIVTGSAEQSQGLYMVIDLSGGSSATSYPVSYLNAVPSGGWTDTYKTTKLVLRRIESGTFMMQGKRQVTLTRDYYMGVFEMTQKQVSLIRGVCFGYFYYDDTPTQTADTRISYNSIRGKTNGAKWPSSSSVDSTSLIGMLRSRTGLQFDLPTEAQWEYACRAGTTSLYNNGSSSTSELSKLAYYYDNWTGAYTWDIPMNVGSFKPNSWGLYDMHGNVREWCLDWYGSVGTDSVTDPKGPSTGSGRICRGGSYNHSADQVTSLYRENVSPDLGTVNSPDWTYERRNQGFRLCLTLSE